MDQSVDSIGACSLDADASVDMSSDWSEQSSVGTLRSASLLTPDPQPHLPSYLSLACTVSGYCTTTNYDPERLSRSRDASPHRPNVVKFATTESSHSYQSSNGTIENKSFIQQRVERLYGPGALAQGFFINKRQSNNFDGDNKANASRKNVSKLETSLNDAVCEGSIKQSTSSPTLPVLRHLRPEFRAQLPIVNPKRGYENSLPKSYTENSLSEKPTATTKINGHSNASKDEIKLEHLNGNSNEAVVTIDKSECVKNGDYFLKILENETNRLLILAEQVESELENEGLTEDVKGKLRSASGKARLLTSQKMQQFKGLCTKNITQKPGEAFPTTNEDLEGFWDMVLLQIDQVDALFKEIDAIRANNWEDVPCDVITREMTSKVKKSAVKLTKQANNSSNIEARKKREAERKQLIEEKRRAARERKKQETIQFYVPESS